LILDLVPAGGDDRIEQWRPADIPAGDEGDFLAIVGEAFLRVGGLGTDWKAGFEAALAGSAFLESPSREPAPPS
jgi:hypothetical protein